SPKRSPESSVTRFGAALKTPTTLYSLDPMRLTTCCNRLHYRGRMSPRSPRPSGVTIRDVAAAAAVSRSTVSRAFTRPQLLSPETVRHVLAVAARLGYVGNQAARALSTGRFGNIAVVVPDIANPFFPPLVRSLQLAAEAADLAVFLGDSDESA